MAKQRSPKPSVPMGSTGVTTGLPELKGMIYTYGVPGQAVRYTKATKAIAEYAGTKYSKEMWNLVHNKEEATFTEPNTPADTATRAEMKRYEMKLRMVFDKEEQYHSDKAKLFRVIMGQCTTAMKNKVESTAGYDELEKNDDVIGLLKVLKSHAYTTDNVQYEYWIMQASMRKLIEMKQEPRESLSAFAKRFLAQLEVTEDVWGMLIPHKMKGKPTADQEAARNKYLACVFLAGVDKSKYGNAVDDLNNDFLLGAISYPEDVPSMMTLLSNRRGDHGGNKYVDALKDGDDDSSIGSLASFLQREKKDKVCYCCGERGHTSPNCPQRSTIPSKEWYIKKKQQRSRQQHFQSEEEASDAGSDDNEVDPEEIAWSSAQIAWYM